MEIGFTRHTRQVDRCLNLLPLHGSLSGCMRLVRLVRLPRREKNHSTRQTFSDFSVLKSLTFSDQLTNILKNDERGFKYKI